MLQLLFCTFLSLVFLALMLAWASQTRRKSTRVTLNELLAARHQDFTLACEHLALCNELLQQIQAERRETALACLDALREDFGRVDHLLNHATKFLPGLDPWGEFGRVARGFRFRVEFQVLRGSIRLGFMPSVQIGDLTREVARLWDSADRVLAQVACRNGLPSLQEDLNKP